MLLSTCSGSTGHYNTDIYNEEFYFTFIQIQSSGKKRRKRNFGTFKRSGENLVKRESLENNEIPLQSDPMTRICKILVFFAKIYLETCRGISTRKSQLHQITNFRKYASPRNNSRSRVSA